MRYYYPDYFDDFKCVSGKACPDSCCHIWQIIVDKPTLRKYKKVDGELGKRMCSKINHKTGLIEPHGEEHRCEFLNDDNLCDIVCELGEEYLSNTCHTHPRHEEVYQGFRERSIAITCPIACKNLLKRKKPVAIKIVDTDEKDKKDKYFDKPLFDKLTYIRDEMLSLSQDRELSVYSRMGLLLGMAHDLQRRINSRRSRKKKGFIQKFIPSHPEFTTGECEEIEKIASTYREEKIYMKLVKLKTTDENAEASMKKYLSDIMFTLCTMEALKPAWIPCIQSFLNVRNELTDEEYLKLQREFNSEVTEIELEQLLYYFVYLYCCSAAYDEMLLAKIKMAVVNTVLIRELWFMKWLEDDKEISIDGKVEMSHWFVREVENSDENMEQWDSLMQRNPRFSLEIILYIIDGIKEI